MNGFRESDWVYEPAGSAMRLARDTLAMKPVPGVPSTMLNVMDIPYLEARSGHPEGSYARNPEQVYLDFQRACGCCMIDQFIPENPGTMHADGYGSEAARGATTGAQEIVLDGMRVDSPEAVAAHLEAVVFPRLERAIRDAAPCEEQAVAGLIETERHTQDIFGPDLLKVPYGEGFGTFPFLRYGAYGYVNYFTAFLMFPELMEKDFALQAALAERANRIAARAMVEGHMPKVLRLDHDMASSQGTLVDIRLLDRVWLPYFAQSIAPYTEAGVRLLWHCDGNLMEMVPRLIDAGVAGFQGFQYECGMDYPAICRMRARDGGPLMIWAGVSVTRTLPFGSRQDVKDELVWLVSEAPDAGLFLGASSSVTPGVPWENLDTLIEGLAYYRQRGRR